jgi:hypothetical protein
MRETMAAAATAVIAGGARSRLRENQPAKGK